MERMNNKDYRVWYEDELNEKIKQLEQENKKLKENYDKLDKVASENVRTLDELEAERIELAEENKKLKERIDELEKCNLNLQERLDRKEELNKSYRKEINQLYEEKLEHRIIEFKELLHGE